MNKIHFQVSESEKASFKLISSKPNNPNVILFNGGLVQRVKNVWCKLIHHKQLILCSYQNFLYSMT